ncbi:uncharacterized protein BJ171DRAFT_503922 [Polychytrium aggregatum]|uniref:uncharacterized protein n=1 Tax=Polychytrium aggregatum TaxID=110093 RepID=UPI0022FE8820|nr:uncharacterized protein BJ171DRAFT_503922 [Polychytrium aggregatum]KAI9204873.1 hypothetical protein BJ171DRAFT_503922 [Polychytrium aggregatum]
MASPTQLAALLASVRSMIDSDPRLAEHCDKDELSRYLAAYAEYPDPVVSASAALKGTLKFRKQLPAEHDAVPCPDCRADPLSHSMRIIGLDCHARPVVYTNFVHSANRSNTSAIVEHIRSIMESSLRLIRREERKTNLNARVSEASQKVNPPADSIPVSVHGALVVGRDVSDRGQVVWIFDFDGFQPSDCNPELVHDVFQLTTLYPERLGLAVLLNTPYSFSKLWAIVNPLLRETTVSKIRFINTAALRSPEIQTQLGDAVIRWVEEEMMENGDVLTRSKKCFWEWRYTRKELGDEQPEAEADLSSGDEELFPKLGSLKNHDPRGIRSYVYHTEYELPVDRVFVESYEWEKDGKGKPRSR